MNRINTGYASIGLTAIREEKLITLHSLGKCYFPTLEEFYEAQSGTIPSNFSKIKTINFNTNTSTNMISEELAGKTIMIMLFDGIRSIMLTILFYSNG